MVVVTRKKTNKRNAISAVELAFTSGVFFEAIFYYFLNALIKAPPTIDNIATTVKIQVKINPASVSFIVVASVRSAIRSGITSDAHTYEITHKTTIMPRDIKVFFPPFPEGKNRGRITAEIIATTKRIIDQFSIKGTVVSDSASSPIVKNTTIITAVMIINSANTYFKILDIFWNYFLYFTNKSIREIEASSIETTIESILEMM